MKYLHHSLTRSFEHSNDLATPSHGNIEVEAGGNLDCSGEVLIARLKEKVWNETQEEDDATCCCCRVRYKKKNRQKVA